MKNIKIYFLLLLTTLVACEETIDLDPDQVESVVVIEGLITNQEKYHYIRVTETVDFYSTGTPTPITTASVVVTDDSGNTYPFEHNQSGQDEFDGYYFPASPFAGVIGRSYTMDVVYNGEAYVATDHLYAVTAIDSLEVIVNEDEFEDPDDPNYFYEVLFYAKEPQETEDYYLFKFYRNDSLILDDETDIYFSDDQVLAEQINGIPTAGFYTKGDTAVVEMYSISKQAFIYYNDLINLLKSDGGMFGSPPVNPRNNISNGAMGYFQTSAMVSDTAYIE